jgi:hypothetical protein
MKYDFLISSERSGSNLITKLLDNHSQFCGPTPPHLLRVFIPIMHKYNDLNIDENWNNFLDDIVIFFNCKIGVWYSTIEKNELLKISERNLFEVVKYIYNKESKFHKKNRLFIKEVKTYNFYNYLKLNFNDPKFIWLVRDPRDMALSWKNSPVHRRDIVRAANIWKEDQRKTLDIYNNDSNKIIYLKYENLLANQEETLKKYACF